MRVPLVILKMWSDSLAKCGSIFPEFRISLKKKRKKNRDSKEYEKNRTRKFSAKWQVGWPWPEHDHDKGMICEWCIEDRQTRYNCNSSASSATVEREEEEGWWGWSSSKREGGWRLHEGVISDYDESEAEMTEEKVLKKLEKELLWNKNN